MIFIIRIYQKFSSNSTVRHCRFYPTCSQYFIESLQKYGFFKGSYIGIKRILRCHPFNPGGYDPLKWEEIMNLDFIAKPMGMLVELLYNMVSGLDSSFLSAYAIAIILSTIIFKLLMMPFTLKQSKSMKKMQELNPQIKELQEKYGKDPQTLQRKQMELYKEANYSPFSGCLPMLLQFPILIAFFYVIRSPEIYVFDNQEAYNLINKTFLWIKDLSFAENYEYANGTVNGIFMGMKLPFLGAALPILAAVSGFTTYLTTKMTSQPAMNEQQEATQKSMNMMMPVMIFVFGLQFPAGLALYWVVSNIFQLVQQYIIMNSSKNPKEELK